MAGMFGIIVSGRPVIVEPASFTSTQMTFTIPTTPPFNHLVVFLQPGVALPADQAAAVYIQLAAPAGEYTLLGAISSSKPSAIFRTRNFAASAGAVAGNIDDDAMVDEDARSAPASDFVVVGISLEPVAQIEQTLARQKAANLPGATGMELVKAEQNQTSPVMTKVMAQRIISNAFNFLASFGSDVIPLKAFEEWWKKFERKIEMDPTFLERETAD